MYEPAPEPPKSRRAFLRWVAAIAGSLAGVLTVAPALRAFAAPLFAAKRPEAWVRLGEASEFELELPTKVDFVQTINDAWVEQRGIHNVWVYTEDGETFTVYNGRCPHLGCGFSFDTDQKVFHCPCHHGVFDAKTGAVTSGPPPRALDALETKIERGVLYAKYQDFRVGIPQKQALG